MNNLFSYCEKLAFIDISHFNMINVISYDSIFLSISEEGHIIYNESNIPEEVIKQIPEKWKKN